MSGKLARAFGARKKETEKELWRVVKPDKDKWMSLEGM